MTAKLSQALPLFFNPTIFTRPEHRVIFNAIFDFYNKNGNCDFLSVIDLLKKNGFIKNSDNPKGTPEIEYPFGIFELSYTNAFAVNHAKIIKEHAEKHRLLDELRSIALDTANGLPSVEELQAKITNLALTFDKYKSDSALNNLSEYLAQDFNLDVDKEKLHADRKTGFDAALRKLKIFQRDTGTTFFVVSNSTAAFESFKESGGIEYSAVCPATSRRRQS